MLHVFFSYPITNHSMCRVLVAQQEHVDFFFFSTLSGQLFHNFVACLWQYHLHIESKKGFFYKRSHREEKKVGKLSSRVHSETPLFAKRHGCLLYHKKSSIPPPLLRHNLHNCLTLGIYQLGPSHTDRRSVVAALVSLASKVE